MFFMVLDSVRPTTSGGRHPAFVSIYDARCSFFLTMQRYNIFRNVPNFRYRFGAIFSTNWWDFSSRMLTLGIAHASMALLSLNRILWAFFYEQYSRCLEAVIFEPRRLLPGICGLVRTENVLDIVKRQSRADNLPWQCDFVTLWH